VVLVIDDLHWADQSTLDVLMYVVAGAPTRRLALLTTVRRGEVGEGHPLSRWLADVRRLPLFGELALGPLDRAATREQLAVLLGAPPHESLVGEVFTRTGGNPYLNRLLVSELPAGASHLPPGLPGDLREAALRSWQSLSPSARDLVRVIAVGGQVAAGNRLQRAVELAAVTTPGPPLREAVAAGILDVDARGGYWVHHPLQAESLEASLSAIEREQLHGAFALACEGDLDPTSQDLESLIVVADHHHLAGHAAQAYAWALKAADCAYRAGGANEQLRLLRRALGLRDQLPDASESYADLWDRLRRSAAQLGDFEEELAATDALLTVVDSDREPLHVAELMVRSGQLKYATGRGFVMPEELGRAVDLTRSDESSWQHAYALAEFANSALWRGEPEAPAAAAQALKVASAAADPAALPYALAVNAWVALFEGRLDDGLDLAGQAVSEAARVRDGWAFVRAAVCEANAMDTQVNPLWARTLQRRRQQLEELDVPHPYVAWLSACEATGWLDCGDWERCAQRVRVALGSDPGVAPDVGTRLVAARLAALQGRQREAEAHLARAEEIFANPSAYLSCEFDAVRAIVRQAAGDLDGVVRAVEEALPEGGFPPTMCEWLMPLASRALADQAQSLRDAGLSPADPLAQLDRLHERYPNTIPDMAWSTEFYQRQLAALDALYAAERARARGEPQGVQRWLDAVELLDGILPWEAAYACWRAGEAVLVTDPKNRDKAAAALRRGHRLATRLQAQPVQREIEELARAARIPLEQIGSPDGMALDASVLKGLTSREREILKHIVAGRTYGEIARDLVLSEKTVSSHVSNILRKTGTANRVDLSRLALHAQGERAH
jgi:DNA-binding CsgD family transcriptional regulator